MNTYKLNIIDIKYFHNELTNLEMKFSTLKLNYASNQDGKLNEKLLKIIANTERNFILQKRETSITQEAQKIEQQSNKELLVF